MNAPGVPTNAASHETPVRRLGVDISPEEIRREAQYHPAASWDEARESAANALAVRAVLLRRARRVGLLAGEGPSEDEITRAVEMLIEREVPVPSVSREACLEFYQSRREQLRTPELREISHVLLASEETGGDVEAKLEAHARELLAELRARPDRFESIARTRSACPSGSRGGSLGQLRRGELDAEVERACDGLAPGEIAAEPVRTSHGVHIVRLDARAPGRIPPFESVRSRIEIYLRDSTWRRALRDYVDRCSTDA